MGKDQGSFECGATSQHEYLPCDQDKNNYTVDHRFALKVVGCGVRHKLVLSWPQVSWEIGIRP
eukprot:2179203-Amphidinium_carterae.1